jgi:prophage antirepressor-like protein
MAEERDRCLILDNNLEIFLSNEFGQVRTVLVNNTPYFVGKDVATALGYKETAKAVREKVENEDKGVSVLDTPGGKQNVTIINESGLYSLILSSKLPRAKEFKHWVTSEVLPAIRKTGSYTVKESEVQKQRATTMLMNARTRQAGLWLKIAQNTGVSEYKEICNAYAANTLADKEVFALPQVEHKTYTATEVGEQLGISAHRVGTIAKQNNLKTEQYGKWFYDKSKYSAKQVETFRYNEAGVEAIRTALSNSGNSGKIVGYEDYIDNNGEIKKVALVQK